MLFKRLGLLALLGGLGVATAACTDGYGYNGVALGYGGGGYYGDGYYDDGYYGNGFVGGGFGSYYGWNDGFYYPGTGVYVYDRYRRPFRWNGAQQRYWQGRRNSYYGGLNRNDRRQIRDNWQDFNRDVRDDRRDYRRDVRDARQDYRAGTIDRGQFRAERRDARQDFRRDYRQERRQLNRQNRRAIRR